MINSFDTDIAVDVGINAAILYKNIQFWCEKNRTNGQNEFEGLYWTYNSISAFEEQFPYLSTKQIRTALALLEERGYIKSGVFNKSAYDRTKWYADLKADSICQNGTIDLPSRANVIAPQGEPIPYINTDINTDSKKKERKKETTFDEILDSVEVVKENPSLKESLVEYIKMRKLIKKPLTDRALKLNINEALKLAGGDPTTMQAIIEQSIKHSWAGVYSLKDNAASYKRPQATSEDFWEQAFAEAKMLDEEENNAQRNNADVYEGLVGYLPDQV